MIIGEALKSIFSGLSLEIENRVHDVQFHYGDQKELHQWILMRNRSKLQKYPLIWYVTNSYEQITKDKFKVDSQLILFQLTKREYLNTQRSKLTYLNSLNPLYDLVNKTLSRSPHISLMNDGKPIKCKDEPNYGVETNDPLLTSNDFAKKTAKGEKSIILDVVDAKVLRLNMIIKPYCAVSVNNFYQKPSPSQNIQPNDISGLWSWYKGNTGVTGTENVESWNDNSSNNRTLTTNGVNYPQQITDTVGTLSTKVIKKKSLNDLASMQTTDIFPNVENTGVSVFAVIKGFENFNAEGYVIKAGEVNLLMTPAFPTATVKGRIGANTTIAVERNFDYEKYYTITLSAENTTQSIRVNDSNISSNDNISWLGGNVNLPLRLFSQTGGSPFPSEQGCVSFAEIIIYNRKLTTTEENQVRSYLKNKYNHY